MKKKLIQIDWDFLKIRGVYKEGQNFGGFLVLIGNCLNFSYFPITLCNNGHS